MIARRRLLARLGVTGMAHGRERGQGFLVRKLSGSPRASVHVLRTPRGGGEGAALTHRRWSQQPRLLLIATTFTLHILVFSFRSSAPGARWLYDPQRVRSRNTSARLTHGVVRSAPGPGRTGADSSARATRRPRAAVLGRPGAVTVKLSCPCDASSSCARLSRCAPGGAPGEAVYK